MFKKKNHLKQETEAPFRNGNIKLDSISSTIGQNIYKIKPVGIISAALVNVNDLLTTQKQNFY